MVSFKQELRPLINNGGRYISNTVSKYLLLWISILAVSTVQFNIWYQKF